MYATIDDNEFDGLEALANAGVRLDRPAASVAVAERVDFSMPAEQASAALDAVVNSHVGRKVEAAPAPAEKPIHPKYTFRSAIQSSRELKGATKLVALLLADFVNIKDGYACPTVRQIMDKLGMPETSVHRALRNLKDQTEVNPTTGEEEVVSGWFHRVQNKAANGADLRNYWFPNYAKAGSEVAKGGGCQIDRGGCQIRHPRVPPTAPLILTSYSLDTRQKKKEAAPSPSADERPPISTEPVRTRSTGQPARVPIPSDYQFPAEAVAAAKAGGITDDALVRTRGKFLAHVKGRDTLAGWDDRGAKWLARERPSAGDEIVTVFDGAGRSQPKRRGDVKPWDSYQDSAGKSHRGPYAPRVNSAGSRYAL